MFRELSKAEIGLLEFLTILRRHVVELDIRHQGRGVFVSGQLADHRRQPLNRLALSPPGKRLCRHVEPASQHGQRPAQGVRNVDDIAPSLGMTLEDYVLSVSSLQSPISFLLP